MKQHQTRNEWQLSVDLASFYLHLDSARKYGLVTGGPEINLRRCEEILEAGRAQGITPSPNHVEEIARILLEH